MSGLKLRDVRKSFGSVEVIKGIDLDIEEKQFVVFVGPSGCGKSTLLRMIAGLETTTSGDIEIGGQRVNDVDPSKRGIAMVFQSYALYPQMTVERNLSFGLRVSGMPKAQIKERVDRAAGILQLQPLLQRKPSALSGGQRQRVAIGRALVRDVDVFLFDEPLSNLDAKLRAELRVEIKRLHQRLGNTMIYVTHDQIEALTLADRIAVMKAGVIQQLDAPLTIYNKPKNRYVAGFIGSPSMNFLKGSIAAGGNAPSLQLGAARVPLNDYAALRPMTAGTEVEFGVRPEHIRIGTGPEAGSSDAFAATVDLVEPMGSDALVWLNLDGQTMSARVESSQPFTPGQPVSVRFRVGLSSLFDAKSGDRL